MDDMAADYYHPAPVPHYPYYHPPPSLSVAPPPPGAPAPQHPPPAHHLGPPYHHQPPPYGSTYSLPPPPTHVSSRDEVRTLFIAGLPEDVKAREIYNLFREFPGYQSSQLRSTGGSTQAYAFAVFVDQQSALAAMHPLNGLVFDLEKGSKLFIEFAKSNSRSKRTRTDEELPYLSEKKVRGSSAYSRAFSDSGVGSNLLMTGMGNPAHSFNGYPSSQSHTNFGYDGVNGTDPSKLLSQSTDFAPQSNKPCPTLFVANLGPSCSEKELTDVFASCPGFLKLKMQNKNGVPVAFVDFKDVACSTGALNHLQGHFLYSSVGEGMRLEYAKSRMGLRKREPKI